MPTSISRIKKRDGTVEDFVQSKITNAIFKAMETNDLMDKQAAQSVSDIVAFVLEDKFGGYIVPAVRQIQDIVEIVLMKKGYHEIAKSYILYREKPSGQDRYKWILPFQAEGADSERAYRSYCHGCESSPREVPKSHSIRGRCERYTKEYRNH
tara:strand:+ start:112 stop:570 length:459 start_codon:yes stop_codon:yes gene_type:complete